jgi:hypothetical protein
MDDIGKRLRETADRCIKAYEGWSAKQSASGAREELLEAVHELRRVASRVEVEVAVAERDEMAASPLSIPPHRAARGPYGGDQQPAQRPRDDDEDAGQGSGQPQKRRDLSKGLRGPRASGGGDAEVDGNR